MRALLVVSPTDRTPQLLTGFDPAYWNTHSGDGSQT
jgi:hypothetical protein